MIRRVAAGIGNRGVVLATLGVIWVLSGIGLADEPQRIGLVDEHLPAMARAALWLVPGGYAVLASVWRRLDEWAWALLIAPLAIGFLARLFAWGTQALAQLGWFGIDATGPHGVWRGALIFAALGLLVNRCGAGLDRPALLWDGRERRWTPQQ